MNYEINCQKEDGYNYSYYYQTKNDFGQCLHLEIYKDVEGFMNVLFYIASKRKQGYQFLKQTGKDGLKSLIWAKNCIIDFIERINKIKKSPIKRYNIRIFADDNRRMKVYEHALVTLGFKPVYTPSKYLLYKWE